MAIGIRSQLISAVKLVAERLGFQIAGRQRVGVNFWHDFRRLDIQDGPFFDVGANIGQWAMECRRNHRSAVIYSFEPEPTVYKKLCLNFKRDEYHHAFQLALSSRVGAAVLRIGKYDTMHSLEPQFSNHSICEVSVQTDTLDNVAKRLELDRIALLKLDVEGHELECLRGAARLFEERRIDSVLAEVGFFGGAHTQLCQIEPFLGQEGFRFLALYETVTECANRAHVQYSNALFTRKDIQFR